ncbi:YeeE/YedE thiosulfate transporter family protein [Methylomonas sp. OY6]|uniref:YeeE/YedE thiosulfate transporter family protein n=1 Tax=Methylomonas defluvii TaxID=3045149 RepID=A0ABU4UIL5_9GAMM|nr:YeeE/YedE thiosulfate transporter family protein [Methylomonas sp. OY6]MDX8129240.1 YeeE/YedE thiosulfate transporter family protein [Methylomonas sp. OY6]
MNYLTILSALAGGAMIGLAAALLLFTHKHTAGISGIAAGMLPPWNESSVWRGWFLAGLLASGPLYRLSGADITLDLAASPGLLAIAGLLVGYGTRLGGGCTSGHGVCGIARLSMRSIVATLTFMLTAGVTVFITRHLL